MAVCSGGAVVRPCVVDSRWRLELRHRGFGWMAALLSVGKVPCRCTVQLHRAVCPPPRDSSMAGRFSGAGGRLPIQHGVGGFAIQSAIQLFVRKAPCRVLCTGAFHFLLEN